MWVLSSIKKTFENYKQARLEAEAKAAEESRADFLRMEKEFQEQRELLNKAKLHFDYAEVHNPRDVIKTLADYKKRGYKCLSITSNEAPVSSRYRFVFTIFFEKE